MSFPLTPSYDNTRFDNLRDWVIPCLGNWKQRERIPELMDNDNSAKPLASTASLTTKPSTPRRSPRTAYSSTTTL